MTEEITRGVWKEKPAPVIWVESHLSAKGPVICILKESLTQQVI